jgi:nucleoside-specific outer membrane channel protein Tsx
LEELKTKPQHLFSIAQASQLIPLNLSAPNDLSSITSRKKIIFLFCQTSFFSIASNKLIFLNYNQWMHHHVYREWSCRGNFLKGLKLDDSCHALKTIGFTLTMLVAGANFDTRLQLAN